MLTFYLALIDEESDKEKFEKIYYAFHQQMIQVAYGVLHNYESAEDAVQNAFIGIAQRISSIRMEDKSAVKAYVLTAARNEALTIIPQEKKMAHEEFVDELYIDDSEALFERCVRSEEYEQLRGAIGEVPLLYREVLLLYYVHGFNTNQIADTLHRKPATVRQQLARAKNMTLARYLERCPQED